MSACNMHDQMAFIDQAGFRYLWMELSAIVSVGRQNPQLCEYEVDSSLHFNRLQRVQCFWEPWHYVHIQAKQRGHL